MARGIYNEAGPPNHYTILSFSFIKPSSFTDITMSQETEAVRLDQASLLLENQMLSNDAAPFEVVDEEDTSPLVDCENSTPWSTGIIQKAAKTSSELRTAPPTVSVVEFPPPLDTRIPLAILDGFSKGICSRAISDMFVQWFTADSCTRSPNKHQQYISRATSTDPTYAPSQCREKRSEKS